MAPTPNPRPNFSPVREGSGSNQSSEPNRGIPSVGGLQAQAKGRGDVKIEAIHQGVVYPIRLCNILYVPTNRNNLFSLGRWIAKGGDFSGRKLALVSKQGNIITTGTLTPNNLIQFRFRCALNCDIPPDHAFISTTQLEKSWDVWHRRFGHIGHSGLQKMYERQLVTGFLVNCESPISDCMACTEAKQSVIPFNKKGDHKRKPGELMHIDVWGKYDVASINGFSYYLLLVDDASRYVTVEFLKSKDQATQKIKNYIMHLITQGKMPKAIKMDCGHEFVNEPLFEWCHSKGLKMHMTAPYSPS